MVWSGWSGPDGLVRMVWSGRSGPGGLVLVVGRGCRRQAQLPATPPVCRGAAVGPAGQLPQHAEAASAGDWTVTPETLLVAARAVPVS